MKEEIKTIVGYEICGHPVEFEAEKKRMDAAKVYAELIEAAKGKGGDNHVR